MNSLDLAPATLEQLRSKGIIISIDDFGTGYSSLNYLRQFNFQTLKMDRCFVADLPKDNKARAIAKGLISLAHNLDLAVVAEGVEHDDQLDFLTTQRCDRLQGFLACRPLPAGEITEFLRAGHLRLRSRVRPGDEAGAGISALGNVLGDTGSRERSTTASSSALAVL